MIETFLKNRLSFELVKSSKEVKGEATPELKIYKSLSLFRQSERCEEIVILFPAFKKGFKIIGDGSL